MLIGSHVSFNKNSQLLGSVEEALKYGENAFMFYTGAPQNTNRCIIDKNNMNKAIILMNKNYIDYSNVVVHAPYIINLCNENNFSFSVKFLKEELKRCNILGIKKLVLHPGSHIGLGENIGLNYIIKGLNEVLDNTNYDVTILLETMSGKGTELGTSINQLKYIIDNIHDNKHIGVCLDTCHLNDSGINLEYFDDYLEEFDKLIGINKIGCIHINDSKNSINSHKDRHENIGFGTIGFNTLIKIIYNKKLENIPKILETPYIKDLENDKISYPPYKFEIEMIRNKKFNDNLLDDVRNYYK